MREIITAIVDVAGRDVRPRIEARRAGDPSRVVASIEDVLQELGWSSRLE